MGRAPTTDEGAVKQSDLPLVRPIDAKLSPTALRFITKVAELFPTSERDIIIVRQKPIPMNTARIEVSSPQRERETT